MKNIGEQKIINIVIYCLLVLFGMVSYGIFIADKNRIETEIRIENDINNGIELARYYEKYKAAKDYKSKTIIGNIVAEKFRRFDKDKLVNGAIKQFLINQRGY